jgi:hypothetical protein
MLIKKQYEVLSVQEEKFKVEIEKIGSFLQAVGDTMGVDKGTVSRCIQRVSHALAAKTNQFIKWPSK